MSRRHKAPPFAITILDEMLASQTEPLPLQKRTHELTHMLQGLAAIERGEKPTLDDWRRCSDALNHLETLIVVMKVAADHQGLLEDAIKALVAAGHRFRDGLPIRLDGPGIQAVRAMLEDYSDLVEQLPARTIIRAQRLTERRVRAIQSGRRLAHDVDVMDL
ncbi:MAG: hypothetical protein DCF26_20315 [Burkholderiales bacterium]|nr:MAG: hypothetical protein DCF26_20315 [Burkholderiales bacterium]